MTLQTTCACHLHALIFSLLSVLYAWHDGLLTITNSVLHTLLEVLPRCLWGAMSQKPCECNIAKQCAGFSDGQIVRPCLHLPCSVRAVQQEQHIQAGLIHFNPSLSSSHCVWLLVWLLLDCCSDYKSKPFKASTVPSNRVGEYTSPTGLELVHSRFDSSLPGPTNASTIHTITLLISE